MCPSRHLEMVRPPADCFSQWTKTLTAVFDLNLFEFVSQRECSSITKNIYYLYYVELMLCFGGGEFAHTDTYIFLLNVRIAKATMLTAVLN